MADDKRISERLEWILTRIDTMTSSAHMGMISTEDVADRLGELAEVVADLADKVEALEEDE